MVQYNSYSITSSGQKVAKNFASRVKRFEFDIYGGDGGKCILGKGGKGGFITGTYKFIPSEERSIKAYPGEKGTDENGDDNTDDIVAKNFFANAGGGGIAESQINAEIGADGGAMSALGVDDGVENLIAVAGGGAGASEGNDFRGGGGGGSPGGQGGGSRDGSNGEDAETISAPFAQGIGGDGCGGFDDSKNGGDGSTAVVSSAVSSFSTGKTRGTPRVDIRTYGPPDEINSLTTSINSNYYPVLSWNSNHNGVNQEIHRKERNSGSFSRITTVGSNSQSYTDTNISPNSTYSYKIVQNNTYYQEGNTSIIHTPDERVQVYRNGSWEPATLHTY